ncbi:MAG: PEPxxWA-CTERM sorting domain-containing protein [Sphingomonadaceae bacterium]|nr:PEPxxWA-CTERM sorting domain-containing protein [Sphingomonadaceae bacterium]
MKLALLICGALLAGAAPSAAITIRGTGDGYVGDVQTYRSGKLDLRVTLAPDVPFLGLNNFNVEIFTNIVQRFPNGGGDGQDYYTDYKFDIYDAASNSYSIKDLTLSRGKLRFFNGNSGYIYEDARLFFGLPEDTEYTILISGSAALPEPATWALMITGFGMVGYSLRRSRQPSLNIDHGPANRV